MDRTKLMIISGGQTGADRTALEVARELGIETGGFVPAGWRTDEGADPALATFGLVPLPFSSYRIRTRQNVKAADGTVIFGDTTSPGCRSTLRACEDYKSPVLLNPTATMLCDWMSQHSIRVLNVAGNRRRTNPGIVAHVRLILARALEEYNRKEEASV